MQLIPIIPLTKPIRVGACVSFKSYIEEELYSSGYSQIVTFFERKVHASFKGKTTAGLKYYILAAAI